MNRKEIEQIIFNALETERSHAKSEEYEAKVEEALREFRRQINKPPETRFVARGVCRVCGSMDIDVPCE